MKKLILLLLLFSGLGIFIFTEKVSSNKITTITKNVSNNNYDLEINEKKDIIISLSNESSFLPFHPVKIAVCNNDIFYLNKGNLYKINKNSNKIEEIDFKKNLKKEIVNLAVNNDSKILYLLDKSNDVYSYDLKNKIFKIYLEAKTSKDGLDNHYVSLFFDKSIFLPDIAKNQIWNLIENQQNKVFKKDVDIWKIKKNGNYSTILT